MISSLADFQRMAIQDSQEGEACLKPETKEKGVIFMFKIKVSELKLGSLSTNIVSKDKVKNICEKLLSFKIYSYSRLNFWRRAGSF